MRFSPDPTGDSAVAHLRALARLHPAQAPQLHAAAAALPFLRSAAEREAAAVELAQHLRHAGAEGLVVTTAARLVRHLVCVDDGVYALRAEVARLKALAEAERRLRLAEHAVAMVYAEHVPIAGHLALDGACQEARVALVDAGGEV